MLRLSDVILLGKKILVGVIVTIIPFLILFWGLRFTQHVLDNDSQPEPTTQNLK